MRVEGRKVPNGPGKGRSVPEVDGEVRVTSSEDVIRGRAVRGNQRLV